MRVDITSVAVNPVPKVDTIKLGGKQVAVDTVATTAEIAVVSLAASEHGVAITAVPEDAEGNRYPEQALHVVLRAKDAEDFFASIAPLVAVLLRDRGR